MAKPPPCPISCQHTEIEHYAFDKGVVDGRARKEIAENPYQRRALRRAWLMGHSVGCGEQGNNREITEGEST